MGSHNYAFKYQGKTLGIENAEQLLRIINSGKLGNDDSVFVIADKQWVKINKLPAYIEYIGKTADTNTVLTKTPAKPKAAKSTKPTAPKTRAFAKLMDDIDDKEDSSSTYGNKDGNFDQPTFTEGRQTIHKLGGTNNSKTSRMTQTVAAKIPNPETDWSRNTNAIVAAVVVLLIGITVGFVGGFKLMDQDTVNGGQVILQAQKDIKNTGVIDN